MKDGKGQSVCLLDYNLKRWKYMTVKEFLEGLAKTNTSTEHDGVMLQNLLRRTAFPKAVVTCGIVYLEGYGNPMSIHQVAEMILKATSKVEAK